LTFAQPFLIPTLSVRRIRQLKRDLETHSVGQAVRHALQGSRDTIGDADRAVIGAHIARLPCLPTISVITSIGEVPEVSLRESFDALANQPYTYRELRMAFQTAAETCVNAIPPGLDSGSIANQGSPAKGTATAAKGALSLATDEFYAVLQAGDLLSEHALYEVVFTLRQDGSPDIVYADYSETGFTQKRLNPRKRLNLRLILDNSSRAAEGVMGVKP
jgi:hypothetical protein